MHLRNSTLYLAAALTVAPYCSGGTFAVLGPAAGSWPAILSSVGHIPAPAASAEIFVAPPGTPASADWRSKVEKGAALILQGTSPLAASFGFKAGADTVSVVHLVDVHNRGAAGHLAARDRTPSLYTRPKARACSRKTAGHQRRWSRVSASGRVQCCG